MKADGQTFRCLILLGVAILLAVPASANDAPHGQLIIVVGAGGEDQFTQSFRNWSQTWDEAGSRASFDITIIGVSKQDADDRELLRRTLANAVPETDQLLCLVLIGHGTYFRESAKFNLVGPDVSAEELNNWLQPLQRPLAVINCSSCSGAFLDRLSGPNRIVITATRSGAERNYARFGQFLAEAISQQSADVDHDGSITLLEAFLSASRRTQAYYDEQGRLATEHAILDDNADGKGTPAEFFRGIRVSDAPTQQAQVDGRFAHQWTISALSNATLLTPAQQSERERLEQAIAELRTRKPSMSEDDYYHELEIYALDIARIYQQAEDDEVDVESEATEDQADAEAAQE